MTDGPKYQTPEEGYRVAKRYILNNAKRRRQKSLDLSNFNLDELPPEIGELEFLERLILDTNQLFSLPNEISQLKNLSYLSLAGNSFIELPDSISALSRLHTLYANSNLITNVDANFQKLQYLVDLDLRGNALDQIPEVLGEMPWLERLDLSHNQIETFDTTLTWIINLERLLISDNRIISLPPQIGHLDKLVSLDLANNEIQLLPNEFGKLQSLLELSLAHNHLREFPIQVCGLSRLRSLNISGNELKTIPARIADLSRLSSLELKNNIIESLPEEIGKLRDLTTLNLSGNILIRLPHQISELRQLRNLDVGGNVFGEFPPQIFGISRLDKLGISEVGLTELPSAIKKLKSLSHLDISNNELDELPDDIGELTQLTSLIADNNKLQVLPDAIGKLKGLWRLRLRNNEIEELPVSLGQVRFSDNEARFDYGIHVEGNPLHSSILQILEAPQPGRTQLILGYILGSTVVNEDANTQANEVGLKRLEAYPDIPSQSTGPHFELDENNVITFAPPDSIDKAGNNVGRLKKLHPILKQLAAELVESLSIGNVPQGPLRDRAIAYLNQIDCEFEQIDFGILYVEGVRFANIERASRTDSDLPPLPPLTRELADSLLQIHGAFVLSTSEGLELISSEERYRYSPGEEAEFRKHALSFAEELQQRPDIIDPMAAQFVQEVSSEIGTGRIPERTGVVATGTLRNLTIAVSAATTMAAIPLIASSFSPALGTASAAAEVWLLLESLKKTKAYLAATGMISKRFDQVIPVESTQNVREIWKKLEPQLEFFRRIEPKLRDIANTRNEFQWLNDFFDWLEARK